MEPAGVILSLKTWWVGSGKVGSFMMWVGSPKKFEPMFMSVWDHDIRACALQLTFSTSPNYLHTDQIIQMVIRH